MSQTTFPTKESGAPAGWELTDFQVNLYAEDVKSAIAFYTALGFEESYRYPAAGTPQHVEVRRDGLTIGVSFIDAAPAEHGFEASQDGASVEIVLWCGDTDAAYAQAIAAGATVLSWPHDFQSGRLHVARVFDPLGNPLVLVQKRDASS
jgi:uncharacterized glyoxalase superfamily protein PhnB